jgi:hypothetical protein
MTVDQGLAFLQAHQLMPDDSELSEGLVREYDEARGFFLDHPDVRCIPYVSDVIWRRGRIWCLPAC